MRRALVLLALLLFMVHEANNTAAAERVRVPINDRPEQLNIYLDCRGCYQDYLKTELTFVNYVRNREDADVHVLITRQPTGSGGREFTIVLLGRGRFAGKNDTLRAVTRNTDTEDEMRRRLLHYLSLGLTRFAAHTLLADRLTVSYRDIGDKPPQVSDDPWNYWVFRVSADGSFRGERSSRSFSLGGSLSANRITEDWKVRIYGRAGYDQSDFDFDDGTISSFSRNYNFSATMVRSLSGHLSAGAFFFANSSTYDNKQMEILLAPAVEFNIFPYAESTHRELRIQYRIGLSRVRYFEETIFDRIREDLYGQQLEVTFEARQPWGDAEFSLEGSHLLHDVTKNRLELSGELRLRLFRGFSLRLDGNISRIRDQLSLPKGEASTEEVLLRRRQLATSYRYRGSVGLSFTFGSIFSNIVNSRFGN